MPSHSKRALIALAAALLPLAAVAPAAFAQAHANPQVRLHTTAGDIVVELAADKAPVTARNFLRYVDAKRFDGASFFRASRPKGYTKDDYGIVEGGIRNAPDKLFPPIAHESTARTGLSNTDGAISMARNAPGTAQANFTICVGDQTYLDADPKDPKAKPGYAAFGHVVEGMDVVRKILVMPTDPRKGTGVMKGEILARPVKIVTARRLSPQGS
jgi:peptidyl-prolyl cis-trans isomerase A (cyclophilin A)